MSAFVKRKINGPQMRYCKYHYCLSRACLSACLYVCMSVCLSVCKHDFYKKTLSNFSVTWGVIGTVA